MICDKEKNTENDELHFFMWN